MGNRIKVMLTTEGTYPFHQGGVSTWCHGIVNNLTDIDFTIYSIMMNPFVTQKFTLPSNTEMIKVPLWGTEEPSEHLTTPFSQVYINKRRTVNSVIEEQFIPLFKELIKEIISLEKNPTRLGHTLFDLYKYFQDYDYKISFKSELAWNTFKETVLEFTSVRKNKMVQPSVFSLIQSLGWVYRFLIILNTPLPKMDVTHSAAAAFCGIPCVLAKIEHGTPFLLTEHGLYLREQYLSLSQRGYPSYLNTFLIRLIHSVVKLNYAFADQVSPVCEYNTRWERRFGVSPKRIEVIYNGVDKNILSPGAKADKNRYPTVVSLARIDPVKDIFTLLKSAAIVKEKIPDVRFIIYGSVSVPEYFEECKKLKEELNLGENFVFAGHTNDIPGAYKSGDIIALSSITEGFPYSVVEAMMSGKVVISTDVGGIREALGDCGILVKPKEPEEMARGIIHLLENPELRLSLGEEARERALNYFTTEKVMGLYYNSYIKLASGREKIRILPFKANMQKLLMEKGYALLSLNLYEEAITQFRRAVNVHANSPGVPAILMEIANVYNKMGKYDAAFAEMEKAEVLMNIINTKHQTA